MNIRWLKLIVIYQVGIAVDPLNFWDFAAPNHVEYDCWWNCMSVHQMFFFLPSVWFLGDPQNPLQCLMWATLCCSAPTEVSCSPTTPLSMEMHNSEFCLFKCAMWSYNQIKVMFTRQVMSVSPTSSKHFQSQFWTTRLTQLLWEFSKGQVRSDWKKTFSLYFSWTG